MTPLSVRASRGAFERREAATHAAASRTDRSNADSDSGDGDQSNRTPRLLN
jgi:hypothetical protein